MCCAVVPTLYRGEFDQGFINGCASLLGGVGSYAAPGYMKPEGIIVFHTALNSGFKVTLENDGVPKSKAAA